MTQESRPRLFEPDPVLDLPVEVVAVDEPVEPVEEIVALVEEPARRANPWAVGLWVASVIIVVVSVAGYAAMIESQFNGYSYSGRDTGMPMDYKVGFAIINLAPGTFTVGLACALAAASIHAVQWMRRHP